MGQVDSAAGHNHLTTIKEVCQDLGIPLTLEKVEGPSQSLTFLGITLDTERMEALLPSGKLLHIQNQLSAWLTAAAAHLQSYEARKILHVSHVHYHSQTGALIALHSPDQRLQIQSVLVAYLC